MNAIKILQNKNFNNFNAKIIGDTRDKVFFKEIKNKISNLKKTYFLGPLYGKKKMSELNKSNVLVFPTKYPNEAFPLVILEAMSLGMPVISSTEGGIPDIIDHNINGFLLKKNNATECAKFMMKYLNFRNLSKIHGVRAKKKHTKNFICEIFEKKLIDFIKKV